MKYTLFGFSQRRAVELGLTVEELAILRWFVDFNGSGKMQKFQTDDGTYVWVSYKHLLDDMPILNCNKRNLAVKLNKMVDAQVLKNKTIKAGGSFSTYALGVEFESLVKDMGGCPKTDNGCLETDKGVVRNQTRGLSENRQPNIPLPKNPSIKNNTPLPPKGEPEEKTVIDSLFAVFWEAYPRKEAKATAVKAFAKLKPDAALVEKMTAALTWQRNSDQWKKDGGQFIPLAASWLNARRWEDERKKNENERKYNFVD